MHVKRLNVSVTPISKTPKKLLEDVLSIKVKIDALKKAKRTAKREISNDTNENVLQKIKIKNLQLDKNIFESKCSAFLFAENIIQSV